jgi:hypothetical protein
VLKGGKVEQFCDIVKASLDAVLSAVGADSFSISIISDHTCIVCLSAVKIKIYRDIRNDFVGSTILFNDLLPAEEMDTYILSHMFEGLAEKFDKIDDLYKNVGKECTRIAALFDRAREQKITPIQMYYYFRGYNQGYTSALSL